MMKAWPPFGLKVFERAGVVRTRLQRPEDHTTVMRHNLEVVRGLVDVLRARASTQIELEALRVEVLEAEATIASLVTDLEHERAYASHLEKRLAEFEDAAEAAQRSRPPLRIVTFKKEPKDT